MTTTGFARSLAGKIPSYLLHRATGQARVRIGGRDHYLGVFGSEDSRRRYGELIAQHAAGVSADPLKATKSGSATTSGTADSGMTINQLVLAFMRHADQHYRKNGEVTSEIHCLQMATRSLVNLYGFTVANDFGPLALKAVREAMIESKWVRYSINKAIGRIRGIFRWAVENELVGAVTLQRLTAVAPPCSRDDPRPRTTRHVSLPATQEQIEAVRSLVTPLVRDLVDVQRLTGSRAGELLSLTPAKIDTTSEVWLFHVDGHKTGRLRAFA